jgi:5-methylcytosine-specific restriction endonuclease McrA
VPTGWKGSTRRATLPREFFRNRARALRRDGYRCQLRYPDICTGVANQGDHIGDRLDHRVENLRAACPECHQHRSSQQGGQAYAEAAQRRVRARRRPPERHPGALTNDEGPATFR